MLIKSLSRKNKLLSGLLCAGILTINSNFATASEFQLGIEQMAYSYDEMLSFDVEKYLAENAPHLLSKSEAISHFAGYSAISPKVILAMIEMQSGLVSNAAADLESPLAQMSNQYGFVEQLREMAEQLREVGHQEKSLQTTMLSGHMNQLSETFQKLFPQEAKMMANATAKSLDTSLPGSSGLTSQPAPSTGLTVSNAASLPPANLLSLPYPVGKTWYIGGAHANDGGTGVHSSLDLSTGGFGWGADLSNIWVQSAAPGTVKVHSSCFMEIIHDGGWSTTYYHMSDLAWSTGASINRNTNIGHYASNKAQALCNGGSSTGPHLHFSLKKNGYFNSLNGVSLSGYKIKATSNKSYDTNCDYFNLSQWGSTWCAGNYYNPGVDLFRGVKISSLNGTATTELYYKMIVPAAPAGSNRVIFETSGGTGDVDLYVKKGGIPTLNDYDCRPFLDGNNEKCDSSNGLSTDIGGTWYVMLHGAKQFLNTSITARHSGWYDSNNITVNKGAWNHSWVNVPEGTKSLTISISGFSGDPDLYVAYGSQASTSNWTCRPYKDTGVTETCTINNPQAGQWHIGINGYSYTSGINLKARWEP
ncbi:pre-peptidase C-terminal domain-containing protein [Aliikangiella maris]|uniref:Pre-peptidase C-terminal domain-containing protein n=2 Tax=Aliikangiella maris TaxID=3162458 RepID=A0ABV3MQC2_9GAMM